MKQDAFSKCHPAVNFLFFAGAIGSSVLIQHPAYLLAGAFAGAVYYLLLNGPRGWKALWGMAVLFLFLMLINPLFNTFGDRVLFALFGRPYTLEALRYGAVLGGVSVTMLLWFGCCNKVLTGDKFTSLFGSLIPAVSLLLVMVFRMVPNLMRKASQFAGARRSVGKGAGEHAALREKLTDGAVLLGALISWALEGSLVTGDSMRSRGYGTARRSSFMIYRLGAADRTLLVLIPALLGLVLGAGCGGQMAAAFMPDYSVAPLSWGIVPYGIYMLIPTVLHIKEAVQWHISRSGI